MDLIKGKVNEKAVLNLISNISTFHRIQGSKELLKAAEVINGELDSRDLDSGIQIRNLNSEEEIKHNRFPMPWEINDAMISFRNSDGNFQRLHDFKNDPTMVLAQSPPTNGVLKGKAMLDRDVNDPSELENKIYLTSGNIYKKYKKALNGDAKAIVFYQDNPSELEAVPYMRLNFIKKKDLKKDIIPALSISKNSYQKIKNSKFEVKIKVDSEYKDEAPLPVVRSHIPGRKGNIVLISHYCHYKYGANDNASGSASLIEIMNTLKKRIEEIDEKPRFGVTAFWVPEYYGTYSIVDDLKDEAIFGLNLDMIGGSKTGSRFDSDSSPVLMMRTPFSRPSFMNAVFENVADNLMKNSSGLSGLKNVSDLNYSYVPFDRGSDHDVLNLFGIPSSMIITWPDRYYHTSMDTIDKIDTNKLRTISEIVISIILTASYIDAEDIVDLTYNWALKTYHDSLMQDSDIPLKWIIKTLNSTKILDCDDLIEERKKKIRNEIDLEKEIDSKDIACEKDFKKYKWKKKTFASVNELEEQGYSIIELLEDNKDISTMTYELLMLMENKDIGESLRYLEAEYSSVDQEKIFKYLEILEDSDYIKKVK